MKNLDVQGRRGSAMVAITAVVATLSILSMAMLAKSTASVREQKFVRADVASRYIAEAALADAVMELGKGRSGELGSETQPRTWGDSSFWVEAADLGGGMVSLVSTGVDGAGGTRLQLVVGEVSSSTSAYGAFGDESLTLDSNALVDSYDSSAGSYASQTTGSGGSAHAGENGSVGSNAGIEMYQNSKVFGNATPGPSSSTVRHGTNTTLTGSSAPAASPREMPAIEIPVIPSSGALDVPGGGSHSIPAGDHRFEELGVGTGATLTITGPARVVFSSVEVRSNAEVLIDGSGGPVEIYVETDFILDSNTLFGPSSEIPGELALYLETNNIVDPLQAVDLDQVGFESNAKFYGSLYAPNAEVEINSNFEVFGSLVARRLLLDSNSKVHFDESLSSTDPNASAVYERLAWHEMPYSVQGQD